MQQHDLANEIQAYLRTSDHWRRLLAYLQDPDPHNAHVHSYVYTSIHPESMEEILRRYFSKRGWPIDRTINKIRPRPGILQLHCIEPRDKVHFDLHLIHEEGVGIRPAHGVERDSNLLLWNRFYMEEFYQRFPFRRVGPKEEDACRRYFAFEHWQHGLEIAARPSVPHMHINVETSLHPETIGQFALEALGQKGWEIHYLCPNVYLLNGRYVGKVVFIGKQPEKVYDIGWLFNPDVILEPTKKAWLFPEHIGYDLMTSEQFEEELNQHPHVNLTTEEITLAAE